MTKSDALVFIFAQVLLPRSVASNEGTWFKRWCSKTYKIDVKVSWANDQKILETLARIPLFFKEKGRRKKVGSNRTTPGGVRARHQPQAKERDRSLTPQSPLLDLVVESVFGASRGQGCEGVGVWFQ